MSKIIKIILAAICWIIGIVLLNEIICNIKYLDPWGLTFTFYILPLGIVSILFFIVAIILTKKLIRNIKIKE